MSVVEVKGNEVRVGAWFAVSFMRTLRLPDDGKTYPLPPGLGTFPVRRVDDFADRVPASWRERGGVFLPMYQREALWLGFEGKSWHPCAVKVGVGGVSALTGARWDETLHDDPQDYLVCPEQPWLDGIKSGEDQIRQFVATPLGRGDTVEGQVTGEERTGGIQFCVFEARPGRFPDLPPKSAPGLGGAGTVMSSLATPMGLAAGGTMRQKVYPDHHGLATWDPENRHSFEVHIVSADEYRDLTGEDPPPSPVDAAAYTKYGFPWFDLYDEHKSDLPASEALRRVKSLQEREKERGEPRRPGDASVDVPDRQIERLGKPGARNEDDSTE